MAATNGPKKKKAPATADERGVASGRPAPAVPSGADGSPLVGTEGAAAANRKATAAEVERLRAEIEQVRQEKEAAVRHADEETARADEAVRALQAAVAAERERSAPEEEALLREVVELRNRNRGLSIALSEAAATIATLESQRNTAGIAAAVSVGLHLLRVLFGRR